jgi:hypothetical protein
MDKFKTMEDFGGVGVVPILDSVVSAVPVFFNVTLFVVWLFLSGASYFTILKTTGKKRFWHTLTSTSFVIFITSLVIAAMNHDSIVYLSGYWVGFYVLMTMASWYMLSNYK